MKILGNSWVEFRYVQAIIMMNVENQNAVAPVMQYSMMMHHPIQQPAPRSLPPNNENELKTYVNVFV
ncbi:hypothetical protein ACFS07_02395 [Undibacterium arcticum]